MGFNKAVRETAAGVSLSSAPAGQVFGDDVFCVNKAYCLIWMASLPTTGRGSARRCFSRAALSPVGGAIRPSPKSINQSCSTNRPAAPPVCAAPPPALRWPFPRLAPPAARSRESLLTAQSAKAAIPVWGPATLRVGGVKADPEELARQVARDLPFFRSSGGGVTLSGGEPLMQPGFTLTFLTACQALGVHTLLETCGHGSRTELLEIAVHCDMIYFDLKLMDPQKHKEWVGVDNRVILQNLEALCAAGHAERVTVRTPCIPGVNDSHEEIRALARYARGLGISQMQLLPYNPMAGEKYTWIGAGYALSDREPRDKAYYESLDQTAGQEGMTLLRE